ncbi:MAG TPA: vitamin K epoxide reductase family protein [Candidatus Limnocylindrales bacterium]|nr:vitamin K epoxide reductase family protein [Candidatus Limnocylindrales bacterium]
MKWLIVVLALFGVVAASLALREHYRTDTSPCSINEKWDCGIVNKSPYAVMKGIPVADIGIAGYLLLGALALRRSWRLLAGFSLAGLAFSLYLSHIEASVLEVWCIYCVMSLATISLITLTALAALLVEVMKNRRSAG